MLISINSVKKNINNKLSFLRKAERYMRSANHQQRENFVDELVTSKIDELTEYCAQHCSSRNKHLGYAVGSLSLALSGLFYFAFKDESMLSLGVSMASSFAGAITVGRAAYHIYVGEKKERQKENLAHQFSSSGSMSKSREYRSAIREGSLSRFVSRFLGVMPDFVGGVEISEYIDMKIEQQKRLQDVVHNAAVLKRAGHHDVIDDNGMNDPVEKPRKERRNGSFELI